jgi:protein ImuB
MLWLAVHLPCLSLEAFAATLPAADRERPLALVAAQRITAVNAAAAACGVQPGLKRATALALAADLRLGQVDAARDVAALQAVAHAALRFTPMVALDGPDGVLLEIQASLRVFDGLPALQRRLRQALAPLGHRLRLASAPVPLGAALLARWPGRPEGREPGAHGLSLAALQAVLDDAPVWLLGPGREHREALQGMGLATLGDLRRLPRSGLARRFGEALLDELDRACGRRADPRLPVTLPPAFDSRLELFERADRADQVLAGAQVLLARLLAWARALPARVAAFTLTLHHEPRHRGQDVPATVLRVELAEPALDPAHLQLLLRERLAHCMLPAPTLELQLGCREVVRDAAPSGELFPGAASQREGLLRLLERLRARLGDERVQQLQAVAEHRPERATLREPVLRVPPASVPAASAASAAPGAALALQRPAWLLPAPQPLAERQSQPLLDGRPLQLLAGLERIEAGWWDDALAARDYFVAATADGALVWIYRARLPLAEAAAGGWFLQGLFG